MTNNINISRPLDYLDICRGKEVKITYKNKEFIIGILKTFDIHINIILEKAKRVIFIRGDEVFSVEQNEQN
jgi:small nuclear ribonucleoprotein (snRNP)-like protein